MITDVFIRFFFLYVCMHACMYVVGLNGIVHHPSGYLLAVKTYDAGTDGWSTGGLLKVTTGGVVTRVNVPVDLNGMYSTIQIR